MLKSTNYTVSTVRPPTLYFGGLDEAVVDLREALPEWARPVIDTVDVPERKGWYHNIDHLAFMWDAYMYYSTDETDVEKIALFIAFHDAVFKPGEPAGVNGRLSIEFMNNLAGLDLADFSSMLKEGEDASVLSEASASLLQKRKLLLSVEEMIHATIMGNKSTEPTARLARDLDFYGLSLPLPAYRMFVDGLLTEEYIIEGVQVAVTTHKMKTNGFCRKMLQKPRIYQSGLFGIEREWYARANLAHFLPKGEIVASLQPLVITIPGVRNPTQLMDEAERMAFEAFRLSGTSRSLSLARTNFEQARFWFDDHFRKQANRHSESTTG